MINKKRYETIWRNIYKNNAKILDIGGRNKDLLSCMPSNFSGEYENFDILDGNDIQKPLKKIKTYDYIIFSHVVEHLENPGLALDNIRMMMNKDSKLLILVPNCLSIRKIYRNLFFMRLESFGGSETHLASYNIDSASFLLLQKKFKIKKVFFLDPLTKLFGRFSEEIFFVCKK